MASKLSLERADRISKVIGEGGGTPGRENPGIRGKDTGKHWACPGNLRKHSPSPSSWHWPQVSPDSQAPGSFMVSGHKREKGLSAWACGFTEGTQGARSRLYNL